MSLRPFLRSVLVLLILIGVASASLTAPTTHSVGYKIWGKWWDMMGENGIRNGTIGGAGNVILLPLNIESCVGNAKALQWNLTNWTCVSLNGMTLNGSTFQNSTIINTTIFNATSIQGNGSGVYSLNASNLTGIFLSSSYGAGIYAVNISDFNPAVNATMDRNVSNLTGIVSIASGGTGATTAAQAISNLGTIPMSQTTFQELVLGSYILFDDMDDNPSVISNRTDRGTLVTTNTLENNLYALKYRPNWTQISGTSHIINGQLLLNETGESVQLASNQSIGTWEFDVTIEDSTNNYAIHFMHVSDSNYNGFLIQGQLNTISLLSNGAAILNINYNIIAEKNRYKVTRDRAGNFDIWINGILMGSVLNTDATTSNLIQIINTGDASNHIMKVDNIKIY